MFDNIKCVWGDEGRSAWVETTTYEFGSVSRAFFLWTGVGKASGVAVKFQHKFLICGEMTIKSKDHI
ncbi:MAG: hypothetical protein CM15mP121_3400 [Bacteroidota bacterium]|nr:MAG: hypothetical protein CM15mP121_3400 [Bacteroidota bacterium]